MELAYLLAASVVVALVLGVAGFFLALSSRRTIAQLRAEVAALHQPAPASDGVRQQPGTLAQPETATPPPVPATAPTPPPLPPAEPAPQPAPGRMDPESTIGGKLTIWVGGLALALGGLFLVRYAIENALLGPGARVMLGLAFGAVMVAAGEWTRRRQSPVALPGFERANVPAMLTAVGSFSLFAALYAAHALYGLLGPVPAFLLLAAVALATMVAALLHGPTLAAIGLLAAYGAPFLIDADTDSITVLALYVLAVSAAAMGVARLRQWLWLALTALVALAGFGFLFALAGDGRQPLVTDLYLFAAFMLGLVTFVISFGPDADAGPGAPAPVDRLATAALSGLLLPALVPMGWSRPTGLEIVELAVLVAVPFAVAARYPRLRYLVVLPALLAALRYLSMGVPGTEVPLERLRRPDLYAAELMTSLQLFAATGFAAAAATLAVGTAIALRSAARAPVMSAATGLALAFLMIAYARIEQFDPSAFYALFGLVLAALLLILAGFLEARIAPENPGRDGTVAAPLVGSIVALTFAAAAFLQGPAMTVALGLIPLAAVLVSRRFPLTALRITAVLAIAPFAVRIGWDPLIDPEALATAPVIVNALLWGYGIPAAGLTGAAILMTRAQRDVWAEIMQGIAIVASILTVTFVSLHAINPTMIFTTDEEQFAVAATLVVIGGAFSLALTRIAQRGDLARVRQIADGISLIGVLIGAFTLARGIDAIAFTAPGFALNVGEGAILNLIGYAYGLPLLLYAVIARQGWATRMRALMLAVVGFVALTGFAWVNLTIRQAFSPNILTAAPVGQGELITYSVVWLGIALAMLGAGILWRSLPLRAASGLVLVAVVLKVFLLDLSGLTGVLRPLSFIALGLVLLGIGALYQRALRRNLPQADPTPGTGDAASTP